MPKLIVLALALALLTCSVVSQAAEGFLWVRGHAWQEFSDIEKIVYVAGVMDGLLVSDDSDRDRFIPLNLSAKQYVAGLDELYDDSRNSLIPAFLLVPIVSQEAKGATSNAVESELQRLRSNY